MNISTNGESKLSKENHLRKNKILFTSSKPPYFVIDSLAAPIRRDHKNAGKQNEHNYQNVPFKNTGNKRISEQFRSEEPFKGFKKPSIYSTYHNF